MFAKRNFWPKPYEINKLTPEPAPTVSQLLTFYLEAGVDCALSEEPANRLAEAERPADVKIPAASGEVNSPPPLLRETRAVLPRQAPEPLPTPDAAIATAREAART